MLEITLPETELFDEATETFINIKETTLRLEHSLVSISKWESKWKIPFLDRKDKTREQSIDYVRCMTINQGVDPMVYSAITPDIMDTINKYIVENKTATTFRENAGTAPNRQIVTSEVIYFWMAQYNIPFECQKWHLSRLLALIRIASIKNQPDKKMSKAATLSQYKNLNAIRRRAMHSKG